MDNSNPPISSPLKYKHLLDWTDSTLRRLNFWWRFNWFAYFACLGGSYVCALIVPFGLVILYRNPDSHENLNIILIVLSALSIILQVLERVIRYRERAVLLRKIYDDL